jgi:uncharacterized protein YlxP (DUF503 family)
MAAKKQTYVSAELEWAEAKLAEWRNYVDKNPIAELKDRIEWKPTSKGGAIPMVIASIESQIKSIRDTMKEYLALLDVVDKLREKEEAKQEARGSQEINGKMKKF